MPNKEGVKIFKDCVDDAKELGKSDDLMAVAHSNLEAMALMLNSHAHKIAEQADEIAELRERIKKLEDASRSCGHPCETCNLLGD